MKVQYWPKSQDHLHGGLFRRRPPNIRSHHKGFALSCLWSLHCTTDATGDGLVNCCQVQLQPRCALTVGRIRSDNRCLRTVRLLGSS